ncbi:hypothetical protein KAFR_0H01870 [Kazachstania africana CBS 2517]|uniref:RAVE subunit 2/Rogdi n=1 Tax=Kazachstania africana (strain ATCC 22294 / BCRC 22015 / CBS 2517 / CECT 1963 / NBRC 1671 / NRRL Y-8276) TaxID=1071382 RepID=H2AZ40_KAZAF|nr:hypothetical protein KAFR_0H01870 [Kazachstania africana CBS 2517]CCF59596.1 hypothetical protein KAFR_0H01870 [Kazachstania africana CBS 2517]
MSTELYPFDRFGDGHNYDFGKEHINERNWLITEIIKPELPNIIDNVEKCLNMLNSDQIFKLPISNGSASSSDNSPTIKGVVTRQGPFILDFQAMLRFPDFRKGKQVLYRMNTGRKFPLVQLGTINSNLSKILKSLEDLEVLDDIEKFISDLGGVLRLITNSINTLQNPPRELIFPYNDNFTMKHMFQNCETLCDSTHHEVSLELVLFKNELSIDFRNLTKITKKPWCYIDPETGKSLVDKIKEQLGSNRTKSLSDILKANGIQIEEPSLLNSLVMTTFNTEATTIPQAQTFISRCVTFNNKVVMETEKIAITTSDPTLISISSKLNALEHSISNHYSNLVI